MDKETLFKEIRQGRALLWVGAGLSRYAGYPMGAGVVEKLYKELSKAQRQELAVKEEQKIPECPKWPLPKFAQYFIDLHHGNRTRLIELLDQVFSAEPSTIHVHEQLARIAHIDHIVTTNYDPLFELAYRPSRLHVVERASQIPQVGNKEVTLYKIHGQPSIPESVIVSEDDYNDFFNNADDVVWTYLRGLMSTRTIVFIGYAVEDPNVLTVFDGLVKKLGKLMKPAYAVGPSMERVREERLQRNNIHYIKATGEEFVAELWTYIQATALTELPKDGLSVAASTGKMLKNLGLDFTMRLDGSGALISDIKRANGLTKNEFVFSSNSHSLQKALEDFNKGKNLKPIKIDVASLSSFSHTVEGFKIPLDNVSAILFTKAPNWEGVIDIRVNSELLIPSVAVWTYNGEDVVHIVALSNVSRIEVIVPKPIEGGLEFDIQITPRFKIYRNLAEAREHARLLFALAKGQSIELFLKGQLIWRNTGYESPVSGALAHNASVALAIIELLELVEKEYGLLFHNFSLSKNEFSDLAELSTILRKTILREDSSEEFFSTFSNPTIEELAVISNKKKGRNISVAMESDIVGKFSVMGWVFEVSWRRRQHLLQPIFRKLPDGVYGIRSKAKRIVIEHLTIYDKTILQEPVNKALEPLTFEEVLQERVPQRGS